MQPSPSPTESAERPLFRPAAVQHLLAGQRAAVLPRLHAGPLVTGLWGMLLLLGLGLALIGGWPIPAYGPATAHVGMAPDGTLWLALQRAGPAPAPGTPCWVDLPAGRMRGQVSGTRAHPGGAGLLVDTTLEAPPGTPIGTRFPAAIARGQRSLAALLRGGGESQ